MNFLNFVKLSVPQFPTFYRIMRISLVIQTVKNLSAIQETQVQSLDQEDLQEKSGNPLQYSCLESSMDRGAWRATVNGIPELGKTE